MSQQTDIRASIGKSFDEASFFEMIDRKASHTAGKDMMEVYNKNRKKGDKRTTAYTYDLFYAIIRSVAPTMENMKKNQPELYEKCRAEGTYFCFTTTASLQTMLNNTKDHASLTPKSKTVYNQIKLMLDIGIITKKVNYIQTGSRNPFPCEMKTSGRASGRGKIQLWISPKVLCIKDKYYASASPEKAPFFEDKGKSLPQIRTSSLLYKDKELKSITNTPLTVDKAVLPVGKIKPLDIQGKERKINQNKPIVQRIPPEDLTNIQGKERKINQKKPVMQSIVPENLTKKQFSCLKLWDLMRYNLYQNRVFNEQTNTDSQILIGDLLEQAEKHVQSYRKAKIQSFEKNPAYLVAKNQNRMLRNFAATLPNLERSSFEMVSHAIMKQEKHATKYGYQVWYPINYLESKLAQTFLGYSFDDWDRIQASYFDKNKASKAYFEQLQWINEQESAMVEELRTSGAKRTYELTNQNYWKWQQALKENPYLKAAKKEALNQLFIQKFKPLLHNEYLQRQA